MDTKIKEHLSDTRKVQFRGMEMEFHAPDLLTTVEIREGIYKDLDPKDDANKARNRWIQLCIKAVALCAKCTDDEANMLIRYSGSIYGQLTLTALELCGYWIPPEFREKKDNPLSK